MTSRLPNVRWIDHHGAKLTASGCRFGGEDAGMAIVYHFTPDSADHYPFVGAAIVLEGGMCYAGLASRADSGVVHLRTGLPQLVIIREVSGIVGVPYLVNTGSYDIAAQLAEIRGVASKFKYVLGPNLSYPSATVPAELQPLTTLL